MSTLKVDAIRHNSATSDAITTHSDGTASAKIIDIGGQQLSNRNLLINGDMQISQRNVTSSVAVVGNQYTLDRWQSVNDAGSSKFTVQQVTDAPVGFYNSLKMTSSSAYTPTSTEVFGIGQKIEGKNTNWLMFGSSNAKSITISFFVKSSLTGTFNGSVLNADMLRGYPWTYTISSANTWEYKTVTVAGSQDGTWHNDSREGMRIFWNFGSGTNRSGTAGQWSTTQYTFGATGATQAVATNGATLQITGCQVEVGGTATSFEHKRFADELRDCQRYFQKSYNYDDAVGSSGVQGWFQWRRDGGNRPHIPLLTSMRSTPTFLAYNYVGGTSGQFRNASNGTNHAQGSVNVIGQNIVSFDGGATGWNQVGTGEVAFMYYSLESEL